MLDKKSNNIYLPIRAFGDFISTAFIIKNYALEKIPIVIPNYLNDFFESIGGNDYFNIVGDISYRDQPAFFEFYKVKNFNSLNRLKWDVITLLKETDIRKKYLLDFHSKRLFFTMRNYAWPNQAENIYQGKYDLFSQFFLFKSNQLKDVQLHENSSFSKILIIPDSRISAKSIDNKLINIIQTNFSGKQIHIARFNRLDQSQQNCIYYANFNQLITLIKEYELIISAESLPYHLANFYDKPHFVIYKNTRHFDENFMTPFMIRNNYYINDEGVNTEGIIKKLTQVFN